MDLVRALHTQAVHRLESHQWNVTPLQANFGDCSSMCICNTIEK